MTNEELFEAGLYDELYEQNKMYIYSLTKKFHNVNFEDVISCGDLGFAKALKSYSTDKSTKFLTYASRIINNEILMFIRNSKKYKDEISLNETIAKDKDSNSLTFEDVLPDDNTIEENFFNKFEIEELKKSIQLLPDKLKQIITLRLEGKKQRDMANIMNYSNGYIARLEMKAYSELKKIMGVNTMSKMEEAYKLFEKDLGNGEIARKLNLALSTVASYRTAWRQLHDNTLHGDGTVSEASFECVYSESEPKNDTPKKDTKKHLKPVLYEGELLEYTIKEKGVMLRSNEWYLEVPFENIGLLIEELQELQEVVNG